MSLIHFHAFGVRFSLPLLSLLFPLLARRLGMRGSMVEIGFCLCAHELAHLLAARIMRVEIREIRLLPFGGSAKMENPYLLTPIQLTVVAAAGPAANLLTMICAAAFAHWGILNLFSAAAIVRTSLILMLFNLLPALPLDGGRMLYAMLNRPLGQQKALMCGIWIGRLLAGILLALALWSGLRSGKWNLTLILAAIFILASEMDERSALANSKIRKLSSTFSADSASPVPVRLYQAKGTCSAKSALACMRPREASWFILAQDGRSAALLDGRSILQQLIKNDAPELLLRDLPAYRFSLK